MKSEIEEPKITSTPQMIHQQIAKKRDMDDLFELLKIIKSFKKNEMFYPSLFMCDSCYSIFHKSHDSYVNDYTMHVICEECFENELMDEYKENYSKNKYKKDPKTGLYSNCV